MTSERLLELPEKPLILVVDDDPIIRRLIRFSMEREGYDVTEANNGQEGLAIFQEQIPDIVLLDFMMPVMNGPEFCRQVQKLEHTHAVFPPIPIIDSPNHSFHLIETEGINVSAYQKSEQLLSTIARTPILMITALEDDESVTSAFEAGATDFITKPIHWAILRQRVRHLIHQAKLYQRLEATNLQLQKLAAIDPLTQLANRRVFDMFFERQWRLKLRSPMPLSLIFADIDCFKSYNDTYGHQAGDHCLFEIAQTIAAQIRRPTDLVARYGGEEIIAVLPDTSLGGAKIIAENILTGIRNLAIPHTQSVAAPFVSVSLGVAFLPPTQQSSPEKLLAIADAALYEAKAKGRNCLVAKDLSLDLSLE